MTYPYWPLLSSIRNSFLFLFPNFFLLAFKTTVRLHYSATDETCKIMPYGEDATVEITKKFLWRISALCLIGRGYLISGALLVGPTVCSLSKKR